MRILLAVIVATYCSAPSYAADGFGTKVGAAEKWTVYVDTDAMSDEKHCTALFDDRAQVQLSPKSLAISYRGRGGVQAYRIRFDDEPARALQPATGTEKRVGAALLEGKLYDAVLAAQRVRVQAYTVLNSIIDEDIDLSAIGDVKQLFVKAGCVA